MCAEGSKDYIAAYAQDQIIDLKVSPDAHAMSHPAKKLAGPEDRGASTTLFPLRCCPVGCMCGSKTAIVHATVNLERMLKSRTQHAAGLDHHPSR